jgi:hypothetical protein
MQRVLRATVAGGVAAALVCVSSVAAAKPRLLSGKTAPSVHVAARIDNGPWSRTLKPGALLTAPNFAGSVNPVAGPVFGAGTLAIVGARSFSGGPSGLYVYAKPTSGWSAATAAAAGFYQPPANEEFGGLAVGRDLIAVGEGNEIDGTSDVAVFTPGPTGFTGGSAPAAHLEASGAGPVAASSSTVLTGSGGIFGSESALQVFTEPAGGWSGTVAPAAQLQPSDAAPLGYASMSGDTVAAVGFKRVNSTDRTAVYIFTEPAGGWSGVIHETARIPLADIESLTLSGRTLVAIGGGETKASDVVARAPVFVLRRPAGGWAALTRSQPSAFVREQDFPANAIAGLGPVSVTGGTVAFTGTGSGCAGTDGNGICPAKIWAIGGLSSSTTTAKQLPVAASAQLPNTFGFPIAVDGSTLALSAERGLQLYSITRAAPARVTRATLTGLIGPKPSPELQLSVAAGGGSPALRSLRVLIPASLGDRDTSRTITLPKPRRVATVTLRRLAPSAALRRTVSRIAAHGGRTTLTIAVQLIDAAGHSSQSQLTLTLTR